MATREFEATTRIPTRPLSYANKDMAYNKELMIDYTNGNIYVKDETGVIHDISQTITQIITTNPDIDLGDKIEVTIPDESGTGEGTTVTINTAILQLVEQIRQQQQTINSQNTAIEEMQKVIDAITGEESGGDAPTIIIKPGDIVTDENHQFITQQQITEITNKISLQYVTVTLTAAGWTGSAAPYTQTVACAGATADMARPTIDIDHANESYETAMDTEDAWCNIYRASTGAGNITFYASEKPTVNISVVVEMKMTGLSASPANASTLSVESADIEETEATSTEAESTNAEEPAQVSTT